MSTDDAAAAKDCDCDDDENVELPALEHGYREVPMRWSELAEIIGSGELSRLTRHKSQQRKYEVFKRSIKRKWRSLYDFMYVAVAVLCVRTSLGHDREDSNLGIVATEPRPLPARFS
jgi:Protein of unknown function (DUF3605)